MNNRFEIVEDEFIIQSCYYALKDIRFNIGFVKNNKTIIYESGFILDVSDFLVFDNIEKHKEDRVLIQKKLKDNYDYIKREVLKLCKI